MSKRTSARPTVVFLSASVGAGHLQAASALQETLRREDPSVQSIHIDSMDLVSKAFRLYYVGGYETLVTRLPWLYGFGYWLTDQPDRHKRGLTERPRLKQERWALRRLRSWLVQHQPVLVVHTHFLTAPYVGRLVARSGGGMRQFVVVTDNELHRWWFSEHVDRYFLPNEQMTPRLLKFGMDPERIDVTGIPVHPKWTEPVDADAVYLDWQLPTDRPIVLLSGGANFTVGRIDRVVASLARQNPEAFFLVMTGHNETLRYDVNGLGQAKGPGARVRAIGFTDRGHELASIASLMITKPGGLTTTECLTKGLPMLLMHPVPGQEAANARYLSSRGAAVVAEDGRDLIRKTRELLSDPPRLAAMREHARSLARPGAKSIVKRICEAVDQPWEYQPLQRDRRRRIVLPRVRRFIRGLGKRKIDVNGQDGPADT